MKFKHKLTSLIFCMVIMISVLMAAFTPLLQGTAAADDPNGCSYTYANSKQQIKRSSCSNGVPDGTFNQVDAPPSADAAYQLKSGSCTQTILIGDSSNSTSGDLSASSNCPSNLNSPQTQISITDNTQTQQDTGTVDVAHLQTLDNLLKPLINSDCQQFEIPGAGAPQYCSQKWYEEIKACNDKVFPTIKASDPKADQEFKDQFSACLYKAIHATGDKTTQKQIADALANSPYSDMVAAGQQALGGASGSKTCEGSNFPLSWIICEAIDLMAKAVDGMFNLIVTPMLETKPLSDEPEIYSAWSNFRIYGDVFLVIAVLVIVFGESLGGGLIDAYTAKKILPRILASAILINISYYLVAIAVDITNIIGIGMRNLIVTPFHASADFSIHIHGATSVTELLGGAGIAWTFGASIVAAAFSTEVIAFLALFVLLPGVLITLAVVVTVFIRKALIVFLVIISPVAFALYCLPNTEKYFRQWWDTLFKTLLVFPIIAVLFALGDVMGVLIFQVTTVPILNQILSLLAFLTPLFLIPFSFRVAGGVLARGHEFLNQSSKRGHQAILGNANDPDSLRNRTRRRAAGKIAEKDLGLKALPTRANPFSLVTAGGRARRRASLAGTRHYYQQRYGRDGTGAVMYDAHKDDSNVTGDLAKYATGAESRAAAKADLDAGTIDQATYEQRMFSSAIADKIGRDPAMRRRAIMNPATIGYELDPGEAGWNQATGIMRQIAGNDEGAYRSMINEFQYVAKAAAGRADLAGATDGNPYDVRKAVTQHSMYETMNAKPAEINGISEGMHDLFAHGGAQGKMDAAVWYRELTQNASNAKGGTRDAVDAQIQRFQDNGMDAYLASAAATPSGRIDPSTGANYKVFDGYQMSTKGKPLLDRTGNRIPLYRDETVMDRVVKRTRAYERPDPEHM